MTNYEQEKRKEIEDNNRQIKAVFDAIKSEVIELNLQIKIANKNQFDEVQENDSILITNPNNDDFKAEICGRCWNEPQKSKPLV